MPITLGSKKIDRQTDGFTEKIVYIEQTAKNGPHGKSLPGIGNFQIVFSHLLLKCTKFMSE